MPAPRDEQAEEIELLRNENQYLRSYVYDLERKIEKMETEKTLKAKLKKGEREERRENLKSSKRN